MSSPPSEFGTRYCSLCDEYFYTKEGLQMHIQSSRRHPRCTICKHSYLNMNSLRNHFVYSSRHHYCRACDKSFKTGSGLRVHFEQSAFHNNDDDDDDEDDDEGREPGWEDEVARLEDEAERLRQSEDEFTLEDDNVASMTKRIGLLNLKKRTVLPTVPSVFQHNCPICLAGSSSVSTTRCGHSFCTPCLENVIENTGMCPTCRKPGVMSHLRKIDFSVY